MFKVRIREENSNEVKVEEETSPEEVEADHRADAAV